MVKILWFPILKIGHLLSYFMVISHVMIDKITRMTGSSVLGLKNRRTENGNYLWKDHKAYDE